MDPNTLYLDPAICPNFWIPINNTSCKKLVVSDLKFLRCPASKKEGARTTVSQQIPDYTVIHHHNVSYRVVEWQATEVYLQCAPPRVR